MPDAKDPETGGQQEYKWSLQDRAYMLSVLARNSKTYIKFCGVLSYETDFLPERTNSYRWTFGQEWICSSREPYSSSPGWMSYIGPLEEIGSCSGANSPRATSAVVVTRSGG